MATKPDLSFDYTPSGWSAPVVLSAGTGTHTSVSQFTTSDTVYLDWSIVNRGGDVNTLFYTYLYVDGNYVHGWHTGSLADGYCTWIDDYSLGTFSVGTHTVELVTDATGTVDESSESNNEYPLTFTVSSSGSSVSADGYENDNSRFRAKTLTVGTSQSHSIHSGTDEDWFKFTVPSDGFYSVKTTGGDTILQLYSFEGQAFGHNDDRGNGDYGSSGTVQLYANTTYYARVTSYGTATFNYTIALSSGVIADAWESNGDNSLSGATTLSLNAMQVHTIHSSSDVDWVKFTISEAGYYYLFVDTSERDAGQMQFGLYDSSGNQIDLSGLSSGLYNGRGFDPSLTANFGAGTYYVKLSAANSGTVAGEYAVSLSKVSSIGYGDADSYEDDGDWRTANVLTLGTSQTHSLNVYGSNGAYYKDVDWFVFTPSVTGTYEFAVSGTHTPTRMAVLGADEFGIPTLPWGGDSRINPFAENYMQAGQTYYVAMMAEGSRMNVDSYTIAVTRTSTYTAEQDNYESDNSRSQAKAISTGQTQAHSIHAVGDQDWMKFTPTTSGWYTFYTGARNGNAGDADMLLALYDSSGTLLTYDDDSFAGFNAMMSYGLTAGQTYYVVALAARSNTVVPYYTVSVMQGIIEDQNDIYMDERSVNDNTRGNAMELSPGQPQAHTIHSSSDVDWVGFHVSTAGAYTIQTTGSGDTLIYVYDENGNYITYDDDSGIGRNASVTMNLAANTDYYARVSAYGGSLVPHYNLSLTEASGGMGDAYESDNTRATAKGIVAGQTQSHSIHRAGDVDWLEFRPIQSGAYQIQTAGSGDMKLDLYSASGSLIASDDDSGTGLNARIGYTLSANTTYYVKAYAYDASAVVDSYALNISLLETSNLGDEYENDNTPSLAKSIQLGQTQAHSIHVAGDVDWVTFTPTVNAEYTIQTTGSGLNCDTQLYIYDSLAHAQSGTALQWDDDSGTDRNALVTRLLNAGTTYYIKAKAYSTYTIPSYGLTVSKNANAGTNADSLGDDYESDDRSGLCKPIAVGREYTHSIHARSDTDWVRFYTHNTGTYTIQTTGMSDMAFIVWKRIPGGRLVPYASSGELDYNTNTAEIISTGGATGNAKFRVSMETNNWYYVQIFTNDRKTTASNYGIRVDLDPNSVAGDAYERAGGKANDNAPSRATWITPNSIQRHSIHVGGDVDFYAIKVATTGEYTLASDRNDIYIYTYRQNSDGTQTFLERNSPMGEDTAYNVTLTANTTYYFKVAALTTSRTISAYDFSISNLRDVYEDDDISARANAITLGSRQAHTLHFSTDVDWVKFDVSSSQAGKFIVENENGGNISMLLYQKTSSGNTLVGQSTSSKTYTLSSGSYFVRMASANNRSNTGYTVNVKRDTSVSADSYESDNTMSTAKSISVGASGRQAHTLHTTSDIDYVKFYATAGTRYTVTTAGANVSLSLYNSSGTSLKSASGQSASTYLDVTSSGYYYARVASSSSKVEESYSVQVSSASLNLAENYVVLFNGGSYKEINYSKYYLTLKDIYNKLIDLGLSADHIYILNADGTDSQVDMNEGGKNNPRMANADWSFATAKGTSVYSATLNNLKAVVNVIDGKMDSNDHFLMLTSDHGSPSALCAWDKSGITPAQFNDAVKCLTTGYQTYLFAECYSGLMLDGLSVSSSYGTRFGMAAASENESSMSTANGWGGWTENSGFGYDFLAALNQYGLSMTTSQMASHIIQNGTYSCPNSYSDNHECPSHANALAAGNQAEYQHPWDKGSNFQIFAQS